MTCRVGEVFNLLEIKDKSFFPAFRLNSGHLLEDD